MIRKYTAPVLLLLLILSLSSCRVFFPNTMFDTEEDYVYVDLDTVPAPEYVIIPGDRITLQVNSNQGYGSVQTIVPTFQSGGGSGQNRQGQFEYLVKHDGMVRLPIIGDFDVEGLTIPQAQDALETAYSYYYKEPMVLMEVTNRRAYVYNSGSSSGQVVPLENENMTLLEVLTLSGGIDEKAKAYQIKVIREDSMGTMIDLVDFSTIEGYEEGNMIVQAHDIIYVETTRKMAPALLREISPILGIIGSLTSLLSVYLLITRTNNG